MQNMELFSIYSKDIYHTTFHLIFLKNLSEKTKTRLNLLFLEDQATRHHSHHIQHHLDKCGPEYKTDNARSL